MVNHVVHGGSQSGLRLVLRLRVFGSTRGQPPHRAAKVVVLGEVAVDCNTVDLVVADDRLNELITAMECREPCFLTSSSVWSLNARTARPQPELPWLPLRVRIPQPSTSANHALQYAIIVSCGVEVLAPSRSSQTLTPSGKPICRTCLAAFFPFLVPSACDGDQFSRGNVLNGHQGQPRT